MPQYGSMVLAALLGLALVTSETAPTEVSTASAEINFDKTHEIRITHTAGALFEPTIGLRYVHSRRVGPRSTFSFGGGLFISPFMAAASDTGMMVTADVAFALGRASKRYRPQISLEYKLELDMQPSQDMAVYLEPLRFYFRRFTLNTLAAGGCIFAAWPGHVTPGVCRPGVLFVKYVEFGVGF